MVGIRYSAYNGKQHSQACAGAIDGSRQERDLSWEDNQHLFHTYHILLHQCPICKCQTGFSLYSVARAILNEFIINIVLVITSFGDPPNIKPTCRDSYIQVEAPVTMQQSVDSASFGCRKSLRENLAALRACYQKYSFPFLFQ